MKTKEEIIIKAKAYAESIGNEDGLSAYDYVMGYTQCQENMINEIKKQIYDFTIDLKESTSTYVKQNCEGAIFGLNRLLNSLNKQDYEHI
jgi:hypothetical protein